MANPALEPGEPETSTLLPPFEASMARWLNSIGVTQKTSLEGRLAPGTPGVSP